MSQGNSTLNSSSFLNYSLNNSRMNRNSSMSLSQLDNGLRGLNINNDGPLAQGPLARWQRKKLEQSTSSINSTLNASLQLNCTLNDGAPLPCNISLSLPSLSTNTSSSTGGHTGPKTPTSTPNKLGITGKLTPSYNRSGSKLSASGKKIGGKTPKTPAGPDRFIPDRSNLNVDVSHYLINKADKENDLEDEPGNKQQLARTEQEQAHRRALSDALNGDMSNYRVIPVQENKQQPKSASKHVLDGCLSAKSGKKTTRHIPSAPERILDAPEVVDDYYLQLLDWSVPFGTKESGLDKGLLAVALNREVYIWNASTGDITNLLELSENDYITSLSWIGQEAGVATLGVGTGMNDIQLWDVGVGKKLRTLRGHESRVSSLSWNSSILSSGCRTGEIHHHDVTQRNHLVGTMNHHSQEICGLKWSPDGKWLASGSNDNTVNIWLNMTGSFNVNPIFTFDQHRAAVKAIGWCPWKSSLLATGGGTADRSLKVWDVNTGKNLHSIDTKSQVCSVIWSKEHHELITGHGYCDNQLIIWKYPTLTKVAELTGHTSRILGMSMSPDGETVVSLGADETLRFWECFKADKSKLKNETKSFGKDLPITSMRMIR